MSKRKNKKLVSETNQLSEELIKAVFEIYAPNKFQLFIMKNIGLNAWFTGNKKRSILLSDILKKSLGEIYELEIKYYF